MSQEFSESTQETQRRSRWWIDHYTGEITINHDGGVWKGKIGVDYLPYAPCKIIREIIADPQGTISADELIFGVFRHLPKHTTTVRDQTTTVRIQGFGSVDVVITSKNSSEIEKVIFDLVAAVTELESGAIPRSTPGGYSWQRLSL